MKTDEDTGLHVFHLRKLICRTEMES